MRGAGLGLALLAYLAAAGLPAQAAGPRLVFADVNVFDGELALGRRDVVVEGERIAAIEPARSVGGRNVIDGRGLTLLPGLMDAHVHNRNERRPLELAIRYGATTSMDLGSTLPERTRVLQGIRHDPVETQVSDVYAAGVVATAPGGHGTQYGVSIPVLESAADADAFVAARVAEGSDFIKVIIEPGSVRSRPTLNPATVAAVVEAAPRRGKKAIVHISNFQAAGAASDAGADGLVHLWQNATCNPYLVEKLKAAGLFVIPALAVEEGAGARGEPRGTRVSEDPRLMAGLDPLGRTSVAYRPALPGLLDLRAMFAAVQCLHAAGVPLLAGSDAPNPGTWYGVSLHRELELLTLAGLQPVESLRAATAGVADAFGLADRGRIRVGLRADLLLVTGDPTRDITATRDIVEIYKRGVEVRRTD